MEGYCADGPAVEHGATGTVDSSPVPVKDSTLRPYSNKPSTRQSCLDVLPLPAAIAILEAESREADRMAKVRSPLSILVPPTLALARLAAEQEARKRGYGHQV